MARRSKTSPFEDLIFIASRLPWWVSLLIAFAAWLFFHSVATSPAPTVANTKQLGEMMVGQMFRTFSMFLQYIVPAAFMLGALASFIGRSKRRKLLNDAASAAKSAQIIDGMNWREFEKVIGTPPKQYRSISLLSCLYADAPMIKRTAKKAQTLKSLLGFNLVAA